MKRIKVQIRATLIEICWYAPDHVVDCSTIVGELDYLPQRAST